jgi:hypothetical protein
MTLTDETEMSAGAVFEGEVSKVFDGRGCRAFREPA